MSTTLEKPPSPSPMPRMSDPVRFVAIRANLMPEEVLSARRAAVVRSRVLAGLVAVVVLLAAFYALSWWQTHAARNDLSAVQRQGTALQSQTREFAPLVSAQAATSTVQSQLQKLMVGDLPWKDMLSTLRSKAPAGVQLDSISGSITAGAAAAGQAGSAAGAAGGTGYQSLNQSGKQQVGTLTLAGTAGDQRTVANYADTLAAIKGLASPFVTSVTANGRTVTFGITVLITSDALGGRYAVATAPAGAPATTGGH